MLNYYGKIFHTLKTTPLCVTFLNEVTLYKTSFKQVKSKEAPCLHNDFCNLIPD